MTMKSCAALMLTFLLPLCQASLKDGGSPGIMDMVQMMAGVSKKTEPQPARGLKIIGAGFGKTGTVSMQKALDDLGFRTYHMIDCINNKHGPQFSHFFDTGDASQVITKLREEGFDATMDFPACLLFKEFMDAYPEAKVVLTVRDSVEAWVKSARATIGHYYRGGLGRPPWIWLPGMKAQYEMILKMDAHSGLICDSEGFWDAEAAAKAYTSWIEHVKSVVPPERLLVHKAKDGYGPLCKFLGVEDNPVCAGPYPHLNDTASMVRAIRFVWTVAEYLWLILVVLAVLLVCVLRRCCFSASAPSAAKKRQ